MRSRVVWANPHASGKGCEAGLEFLNPLLEQAPGQNTGGLSLPQSQIYRSLTPPQTCYIPSCHCPGEGFPLA